MLGSKTNISKFKRIENMQVLFSEHSRIKLEINKMKGTSLMVHWLRICLPIQGTQVRALVREDPTCHGATKPMCHNY